MAKTTTNTPSVTVPPVVTAPTSAPAQTNTAPVTGATPEIQGPPAPKEKSFLQKNAFPLIGAGIAALLFGELLGGGFLGILAGLLIGGLAGGIMGGEGNFVSDLVNKFTGKDKAPKKDDIEGKGTGLHMKIESDYVKNGKQEHHVEEIVGDMATGVAKSTTIDGKELAAGAKADGVIVPTDVGDVKIKFDISNDANGQHNEVVFDAVVNPKENVGRLNSINGKALTPEEQKRFGAQFSEQLKHLNLGGLGAAIHVDDGSPVAPGAAPGAPQNNSVQKQ